MGISATCRPPYVGVWERLVQITKKHLKSAAGDGLLSDVELRTLLAEVESIVNNRPITAVSDDPDDCSALTPNHFLLQRATQLPPGVFVNEDLFSRKRWRKVQFLNSRCNSLKKTEMGQVKTKCADWRSSTSSRR